ncbi:MAG TPA: helix-turn-helix domain-containing protein [Stellaceae bacterium]|nr:helix-turn-helix domain-containing protein [Stellaceae bacterium]
MSPEQCRAARGWLGWSQQDLADRAHVGLSTVRDFEKGRRAPIANNLDAMRRVLELAGVHLVFAPDGTPEGITTARRDADAA